MFPTLQVSILATEPYVTLSPTRHYRIRIVCSRDTGSERFGVAAMCCEDRMQVEWLSDTDATPLEAVRRMQTGFELRTDATPAAHAIFVELVRAGIALPIESRVARVA